MLPCFGVRELSKCFRGRVRRPFASFLLLSFVIHIYFLKLNLIIIGSNSNNYFKFLQFSKFKQSYYTLKLDLSNLT